MADKEQDTKESKCKKHFMWLIGSYSPEILSSKLPSKRNVLSVVYWNLEKDKMTIKDIVVDQVLNFWIRARIPTRQSQHIKDKGIKLYNEFKALRKNKSNIKKRSDA